VWVQRGTEQIAMRAGPSIGGILNVTFGNAPELILALFVLMRGNADVVKGQITGSIIGNSLLGLGAAILVGSWGRHRQKFNREHAGLLSSLLILVVIGLLLPALFDYTERGIMSAPGAGTLDEKLSLGVSIVLIVLYIANLVYSLFTHKDIFSAGEEVEAGAAWPLWKSVAILIAATVFTALEAELVSGSLEATSGSLGISPFFLGVVVLAVVGNAAEYVAAVYFARKDQMSLVMSITVGSTIQVGLLIAPLLVIVSYLIGHPMNLVFANPLEMIAIAAVAFAVNAIAEDGEVTWFEGALLLGLYVLLGIAFFFVTPP
jgi:Ca2+:H+ antiporter